MKYFNEEIGDATEPVTSGKTAIAHCVNNLGLWGSGFVVPLGEKYPSARDTYRNYYKNYNIGDVQIVEINSTLTIFNIFGQSGIKSSTNPKPISYEGLFSGLETTFRSLNSSYTLILPAIGSDRAGGDWNRIKKKIEELANEYCIKTIVRYLK